jgi:hypothetical protein
MCGNINAADAEVCVQCGARLTPVRPPSRPSNAGKFTGGLSWLDAFREETGASDAESASFESGFSPLEDEESSSYEETAGNDDAPDWLQRIRDRNDAEQPSFVQETEDKIHVDEQSLSFSADEEDEDVPDWLRSLKEQEPQSKRQEEEQSIPSWQDAMNTWNTGAADEEEEDSRTFNDGEPKVTEWFNRIIPGDESDKRHSNQSVEFEQEPEMPQGFQRFEPEQEKGFSQGSGVTEPEEEVYYPQGFNVSEDEEDEESSQVFAPPIHGETRIFDQGFDSSKDESGDVSDDADFMAQFEGYEHPSGFSEEDIAPTEGDDLQYEDWETRSATLYSVTESKTADENVPSWLQEDDGGEEVQADSTQSVLNWLDELDQKEGSKKNARYWMGEVDTGELPPDKNSHISYIESDKKESVYDPFAFDKENKPGATQFFSEEDLDEEDYASIKTPAHTMMFDQEEEVEEIPDWLSGQTSDEEFAVSEKKPAQTVGLGGLEDSVLGMDLPDDEKSPWEMSAFDEAEDVPQYPRAPKMTAALSDLDEEEAEGEELPPWMQTPSDTPTEPKRRTPIMTAALDDLDDEEADEEETPPWMQVEKPIEERSIPGTPKMTAALPGLDDEDLGMDLPDDEIPPWLKQAQDEPQDQIPRTPIMTAALDDLDEEDELDETVPWMQPQQPVAGREPSGTDASILDMGDESLDSDEIPPWMRESNHADRQKNPSQPLMTAELPDLAGEEEADLPPWMQEVDRVYDEQPSQPLMTAALTDLDAEELEEEPLPWMQDVEEQAPPLKSAPLMTAALSGLDEEEPPAEETPAWMMDFEEVKDPSKGMPTMTAALSGLDEEDFQTDETPAWMKDLEEIAPPTSMPVMTAALPDLDQDEPTVPAPPSAQTFKPEEDEIPDWMRTIEETRHLGQLPGQQPVQPSSVGPQQGLKSPFTVGLTGDASEKEQSIDEMFSEDLLTTGKLNEMVGFPQDEEESPEAEQSFDEIFSGQYLTADPQDAITGLPEYGNISDGEQSIDEMFSDQLLTTGKLNAMVGQPGGLSKTEDDEQSIDEMFSDQLLTTGKLNAMVGKPGSIPEPDEEDQSVDEMFSDQLLTTGKLNAMVGLPGSIPETDDEDQSIDEMFSDQLLTTGRLNAMSGIPADVQADIPSSPPVDSTFSSDENESIDEMFSDQLLTTGRLNAMSVIPADVPSGTPADSPFVTDENESVDEMFSDQLLTTGILNQMHVQDQSKEGMTIDEEFSNDLLNTGKLRDLSGGLEETRALPAKTGQPESPFGDDWLKDFGDAGSDQSDMLVGASMADEEDAGVKALPSGDIPDWLAEIEPKGVDVPTSERPAFTFEVESEIPAKMEDSHPFEGDDLPNWLSPEVWQADGKTSSAPVSDSGEAGVANIQWELEGLEKGELPSWLQQIKPDQLVTKRSNRAIAPEQVGEQSEKVGPLAGLSGVLPAQDSVLMVRKPPVYSDQINLSERQSNRMQVLSRMMESEAKNKTLKVGNEKIPFSMMRIVFAIVLVLIMIIPLSGLIPITGDIPYTVSEPVAAFYSQVEQFPDSSSVLLVMDFESGYTAEMRSSLDGLMMRLYEKNINVAMISTLPTGPVIAEDIAQDIWLDYFAAHPEINIIDYENRVLNLGYLPGGSAAMLQFVRYPRQSIQYGFRYEKNPTSVWESRVLANVYSINDFSGVVVVTDSANVSRNWIEQSTLQSLNNILFITSAQTYPLILPYWQSGQVNGLIAGVYQGYTYRYYLNQSAGLAPRWYSYQFGMNLVTILSILLTVIFIIRNAIPRRKTTH